MGSEKNIYELAKTDKLLNKLLDKKSELESKLFEAKLKDNQRFRNLGWGAGMRRSKLGNSDTAQKRVEERIDRNNLLIKNRVELLQQLQKGIQVEQEHKETLEKVASGEISVDEAIKETAEEHIKENPNYYDELEGVIGEDVSENGNKGLLLLRENLKSLESEYTRGLIDGTLKWNAKERYQNEISNIKQSIKRTEEQLSNIRHANLSEIIKNKKLLLAINKGKITPTDARLLAINNGMNIPNWLQEIVDKEKFEKENDTSSILGRTKDFLGKDKESYMIPKTDKYVIMNKEDEDYFKFHVKKAIEKGLFEKDIADGRMTVNDAITIIKSYGIKVPNFNKHKELQNKPNPEATQYSNGDSHKVVEVEKKEIKEDINMIVIRDIKGNPIPYTKEQETEVAEYYKAKSDFLETYEKLDKADKKNKYETRVLRSELGTNSAYFEKLAKENMFLFADDYIYTVTSIGYLNYSELFFDVDFGDNDSLPFAQYYNSIDKTVFDLLEVKRYKIPKAINLTVSPENEQLMKLHRKFTSDDELRPSMLGTHFDERGAVSTNGHIMLFTPYKNGEVAGDGNYCYTSKCLKHENDVKTARYPQYDAVLPTKFMQTIDLDIEYLMSFLETATHYELYNKVVEMLIFKFEEEEFGANAVRLYNAIDSLVKLGHKKISLNYVAYNKALVFTPTGVTAYGLLNSDFALVMPLLVNTGYVANNSRDYMLVYNLETNCVTELDNEYCFDFEKAEINNLKKELRKEISEVKQIKKELEEIKDESIVNSGFIENPNLDIDENISDDNLETLEAIEMLKELAEMQTGAEKSETLEAIELLKELL